MQKLIKQILRFGVVGFICFFIEYAIILNYNGWHDGRYCNTC